MDQMTDETVNSCWKGSAIPAIYWTIAIVYDDTWTISYIVITIVGPISSLNALSTVHPLLNN